MIKKILSVIFHPLLLTALALLVISVLIWWVGPLVAIGSWTPLVSEMARWIAIGCVILLVVLRALLIRWRARRASVHLTDGLMKAPGGKEKSDEPENAEQKILSTRFNEAVASLKKMRLHAAGKKPSWRDWVSLSSGNYLYDLPWYIFIGAPGSGKTTALVNSGLSFPLADQLGAGAIKGVGGTRNCDWWFTDEAVLIDTAGRYTTQDSHQADDKTGWENFLQLLKKSRPRRPLNGVFLSLSVSDLLGQGAEARTTLAASIRARLMELDTSLGTRLPVYILVTKSDLLHGFNEYFGNLGKEQRAQTWGFTLPLEESKEAKGFTQAFDREFALLSRRLEDGLIERIQGETDIARRSAVFGFPIQFGAIGPLVTDLLNQVLSGSKFTQTPWVRGVYFTSGTQEGAPIDRMMGNLSRSFGVEQAVAPAARGSGRSYFLTQLLQQVVFPEQRLASADLRWERRRNVLRTSVLTAMAATALIFVGGWTISTMRNLDYLKAVEARIEPARQALAAMPAKMQNPAQLAPVLQGLRDIWLTPAIRDDGSAPLPMGMGLYQGNKIDGAASLAHQRSLNDVFLPQVAKRIEDQLRSSQKDNLEFAYEALKSYLMLHQPEHFDSDSLKAWVTLDWNRTLDRGVPTEQRKALEDQLDALLAQGAPRSPLAKDENLVASVRAMLASYPLEQRIFSRLKRMRTGADIAPFTVANAAGSAAPLVFERASGKPLTEGISGMFTYDGYHKRFQSSVVQLTGVMALEEPWVLGLQRSAAETANQVANLDALTNRVRRIYLEEYVKVWDALLADVRIVRSPNLEKNIQIARTLSSPASPHVSFLKAVVRETTLLAADNNLTRNVVNKATESVASTRKSLEALLGADPATKTAPDAGKRIESIVDDHYDALRKQVIAPQGQPAPIDETLKLFNEVYTYLTAVDSAAKSRSAPPPGDIAGKLKAEAGRLPEPMRTMLEALSQAGAVQAQATERGNLSQDIRPVTEFCQRAIAGRYPLSLASSRDALPEDFGQFFGPGGMMDEFFQRRLANLVDTSARPWKFKPTATGESTGSSAALVQFERAAKIRDIFFRSGKTPSLRMDFKVVEMDAGITQFVMDVDGQIVKYAHGPVLPMAVQWPGSKGSSQVRIQLSPPSSSGGVSGQVMDGPWALFRIMEKAQVESAGVPEKFFVTFNVDNRRTRFEVTTNSVQNPMRVPELQSFSCPEGM
jgi:type VI secretion system protein ImpL